MLTNLNQFKDDLNKYSPVEVIRRRIIYGDCYALEKDQYYSLRQKVADKFDVHPNDVIVVGSAKMGFSIAPDKRYREFSEESDIDLVIISNALFEALWKKIYLYEKDGGLWDNKSNFKKYLFKGWIRPDQMPPLDRFDMCRIWWDFFQELSSSGEHGDYKINGALYYSWFFLENYQEKCVKQCQEEIFSNENICDQPEDS